MISVRPQEKEESPKADCYSGGERAAMEWTQRARGRLLGPLLRLLAALRVTPDHLTLASLLVGLLFCVLWFWSPAAALAALLIHVLLDGLDGPLARHLGLASRRGSFTDTVADQTVISATAITLMADRVIDVAAGGVYLSAYTAVVAIAMVRNAMEIPYSWLLRPRFLVYGWILVEAFFWPDSINQVLWLINAVLIWKLLTGFFHLRERL
ncbi:MAG: CDP-alcohol phosphatidyltransferase family protein [Planctomycetota bacterium]|nr:CDP-alcohol phosphatidyltransferase family protein [Planctomycetota bacterium]MDA1250530.1 CDP-alcohol phosphatidyltransferase family protein [Planctomycetota bacterium]